MKDPAWDPQVRASVQKALDNVLHVARDVLMRYADEDGFYVPPSEVSDSGDVTGLINAGLHQVVARLERELDQARSAMRQAMADVDNHKREVIGPNYRPPHRQI